jgi:hypothetical protein
MVTTMSMSVKPARDWLFNMSFLCFGRLEVHVEPSVGRDPRNGSAMRLLWNTAQVAHVQLAEF